MRKLPLAIAAMMALAVAEIVVFVVVGELIGLGAAVALLLLTSLAGASLLRSQGMRSWRAFREDMAARRPPGQAATDGVLVVVGGLFMLVPGFLTDVVGLLFLLPLTRRLARAGFTRALTRYLSPAAATSLFGPRQVRVRYGSAHRETAQTASDGGAAGAPDGGSAPAQRPPIVEGEIISPPRSADPGR